MTPSKSTKKVASKTIRRFTTYVIAPGEKLPVHPNRLHQRKLLEVRADLPPRYGLAICTGCQWYFRFPMREIDTLNYVAYMHMFSVHFTALYKGEACVDPDLVDGGEQYLRERFAQIPSYE